MNSRDCIEVLESGIVYENPMPQLRSRHAYWPSVVELSDGQMLASYVVGEAFESVDLTTVLASSSDSGNTWETVGDILYKQAFPNPISDVLKITYLPHRGLGAFGYVFDRSNPDLPMGNPQTGGLLPDRVVYCESADKGYSWTSPLTISTSFREPVEASAPITVLSNGDLVSPIANFSNWEGVCETGLHGRLLRSNDKGNTWSDSTITMEFPDRKTTVFEQRLCEMENGEVLIIAWNENMETGEALPNHYALSVDGGNTFAPPKSTGVMGQASSITYLGDNKVLALHCLRRGTDKPGIYAYLVEIENGGWKILASQLIWQPRFAVLASKSMHDVFAYVKFGQPSAIRLSDGNMYMVHWTVDDGLGKIIWSRLSING